MRLMLTRRFTALPLPELNGGWYPDNPPATAHISKWDIAPGCRSGRPLSVVTRVIENCSVGDRS